MAGPRLIAWNDVPPGRYVPHPPTGGHVWEGEAKWFTRHGEATVEWLLGKPFRIEGARTADGRMAIEPVSPADRVRWRRRSPSFPRGWVWGTIAITPDDVAFSDLPHEPFRAPEPLPGDAPPCLAHDVSGDGAFLRRLQDDAFAHAVYQSLRNVDFRKRGSDRVWYIAWGRGAELVAGLRSLGEGYMDFHHAQMRHGDGRPVNEEERLGLLREVHGHYRRLGWTALGGEERAAVHRQSLAEILAAESRPAGPCPDWALVYPEREPVSPIDRAVMAARTGRLDKDEFERASGGLDVELCIGDRDGNALVAQ